MVRIFLVGSALLALFLFVTPKTALVEAKCGAQKPQNSPRLISAVAQDSAVTLTWEESKGPLTHYVLAYGTTPEKMEYGNPNIGPTGTTSFQIDHLTNGHKYYFRLMAVNECKPSEVSDKVAAIPGVSTVLPQKQPGRPPVLSIYKTADEKMTEDATPSGKTSSTNTHRKGVVATASLASCTVTCKGLQFLGMELAILLVFFTIARLFPGIKLSASLLIPLVTALLYLKFGGPCTSPSFFCKYFYPLTFMLYASSIIVYKHLFTHRKRTIKSVKKKKSAFVAI